MEIEIILEYVKVTPSTSISLSTMAPSGKMMQGFSAWVGRQTNSKSAELAVFWADSDSKGNHSEHTINNNIDSSLTIWANHREIPPRHGVRPVAGFHHMSRSGSPTVNLWDGSGCCRCAGSLHGSSTGSGSPIVNLWACSGCRIIKESVIWYCDDLWLSHTQCSSSWAVV
jgi:hypothetical protein